MKCKHNKGPSETECPYPVFKGKDYCYLHDKIVNGFRKDLPPELRIRIKRLTRLIPDTDFNRISNYLYHEHDPSRIQTPYLTKREVQLLTRNFSDLHLARPIVQIGKNQTSGPFYWIVSIPYNGPFGEFPLNVKPLENPFFYWDKKNKKYFEKYISIKTKRWKKLYWNWTDSKWQRVTQFREIFNYKWSPVSQFKIFKQIIKDNKDKYIYRIELAKSFPIDLDYEIPGDAVYLGHWVEKLKPYFQEPATILINFTNIKKTHIAYCVGNHEFNKTRKLVEKTFFEPRPERTFRYTVYEKPLYLQAFSPFEVSPEWPFDRIPHKKEGKRTTRTPINLSFFTPRFKTKKPELFKYAGQPMPFTCNDQARIDEKIKIKKWLSGNKITVLPDLTEEEERAFLKERQEWWWSSRYKIRKPTTRKVTVFEYPGSCARCDPIREARCIEKNKYSKLNFLNDKKSRSLCEDKSEYLNQDWRTRWDFGIEPVDHKEYDHSDDDEQLTNETEEQIFFGRSTWDRVKTWADNRCYRDHYTPQYEMQCPYCGKKFIRKRFGDNLYWLGWYKDKHGDLCYGTSGCGYGKLIFPLPPPPPFTSWHYYNEAKKGIEKTDLPRQWCKFDRDNEKHIIQMFLSREHFTQTEIAQYLDVDKSYVSRTLKNFRKLVLDYENELTKSELDKKILNFWLIGTQQTVIANELDITQGYVSKRLTKIKLNLEIILNTVINNRKH